MFLLFTIVPNFCTNVFFVPDLKGEFTNFDNVILNDAPQ